MKSDRFSIFFLCNMIFLLMFTSQVMFWGWCGFGTPAFLKIMTYHQDHMYMSYIKFDVSIVDWINKTTEKFNITQCVYSHAACGTSILTTIAITLYLPFEEILDLKAITTDCMLLRYLLAWSTLLLLGIRFWYSLYDNLYTSLKSKHVHSCIFLILIDSASALIDRVKVYSWRVMVRWNLYSDFNCCYWLVLLRTLYTIAYYLCTKEVRLRN